LLPSIANSISLFQGCAGQNIESNRIRILNEKGNIIEARDYWWSRNEILVSNDSESAVSEDE